MDWLVKQGTVDAKRVCIVGSSYGGYAALWGVTRNPERYRCAASFAGISDLKRQLRYQTSFLVSERYRKDWRNTVKGQENTNLDALSPLKLVAGLTRPVLLAHGDEDERVPYKQSSLYAEALKKAGKSHEFYTYKGEGHGFDDSANFKDWMDRLDAFLAKHNPS
jgi:dipeptidyl aminopeptidase/acylaminoacyl peptidase